MIASTMRELVEERVRCGVRWEQALTEVAAQLQDFRIVECCGVGPPPALVPWGSWEKAIFAYMQMPFTTKREAHLSFATEEGRVLFEDNWLLAEARVDAILSEIFGHFMVPERILRLHAGTTAPGDIHPGERVLVIMDAPGETLGIPRQA
jgi:hypothetical protein